MHTTLLTTKLYVPPPCPTLVLRPRLTMALSNALTRCLTLVSAPAGYGKTTLVSNWLRTLTSGPSPAEGEGRVEVRAAWLSLDEGDNDPIRFLQYLLSALQKIFPSFRVDLVGVLQGMQPAQFDALMSLYHHLFAEVLNRRLEHLYPHLPAELNQRASQWYEQNRLIPEAISHSLAAGNQDRATQLIEQNGVLLLIRGEVTTLLKWYGVSFLA